MMTSTPARVFLRLLMAFGALVTAAAAGQWFMDGCDARRHPPPGELVESGGFRLHLQEFGRRDGGPTVLLEAGGGSFSAQWGWVAPALAETMHVVAYDRPGLGWSRPSRLPNDGLEVVQALRAVLADREIHGPFVLVGHSFGSVMIRVFARQYPEDVIGLVHVDPRYLWMEEVVGPQVATEGAFARLGLARLDNRARGMIGELPAPQAAQGLAFFAATSHLDALANEWPMSNRTVDWLARAAENLGDRPNIVLSAGADDDYFSGERRRRFTATHRKIASLSTRGELRDVVGADHYTIVTRAEHARRVVTAVLDVRQQAECASSSGG